MYPANTIIYIKQNTHGITIFKCRRQHTNFGMVTVISAATIHWKKTYFDTVKLFGKYKILDDPT